MNGTREAQARRGVSGTSDHGPIEIQPIAQSVVPEFAMRIVCVLVSCALPARARLCFDLGRPFVLTQCWVSIYGVPCLSYVSLLGLLANAMFCFDVGFLLRAIILWVSIYGLLLVFAAIVNCRDC